MQEKTPADDPPSVDAELRGRAGEPIELPIRNGPATGYAWKLDMPDGVERIDDGPARSVPSDSRLGGVQGGALRVQARVGDHVVTARLVQPWGDDPPIRQVRIRIRVD